MISPCLLYETLLQRGVDFYTGVPDSLLKSLCAYITDHCDEKHHIIAANEGGAIGLAAGYHLATGKIPVVYMQNSGMGNAANPLISLMDKDVYHMPVLLVIGWRGEPGEHDEPQHVKQGKITLPLLDAMQIRYEVLAYEPTALVPQLNRVFEDLRKTQEPFALVVKKNTFAPYTWEKKVSSGWTLPRERALQLLTGRLGKNDVIVSTTGMISRELFEYRAQRQEGHAHDFLTVGSMGHASQIALGISLYKPERRVFCFDGDGASLMHMGSWAITGANAGTNYYHIVFNNSAHDSVGGQPTVGSAVDFPAIAKACGYPYAVRVDNFADLDRELETAKNRNMLSLIEVKCSIGAREDLGRPTTTALENNQNFMEYLKSV